MKTVIWWIRRDLRLQDNFALRLALETGMPVLPLFIIDPAIKKDSAQPAQSFLQQGLRILDDSLQKLNSYLLVRQGTPLQVLSDLNQEIQTTTIFAEEDYTPYAQKRDSQVASVLPLKLVTGLTAHHPSLVTKADSTPYTVFTPFSKAWKALPRPCSSFWSPSLQIKSPPRPEGIALPELSPTLAFPAGEIEAAKLLERFASESIFSYSQMRDRMDLDGTSSLSPYFHFGMLSVCKALQAVDQAQQTASTFDEKKSVETWLNELIWREFYHSIIYHFPHVRTTAFNAKFRQIPWRDAPSDLKAWQLGLTGFPVIDAAMRQLATIGWMHNRARMIVASFLTKDLLINWQEGEQWFLDHLVDADIASNSGGWQWTAGVGTDAAPYFRIFNPTLQSIKFDPHGNYIRKWLPELAHLPEKFIHQPELMSELDQKKYHCQIGEDYPYPIVDRKAARERTLQAYATSKEIFKP